MPGLRGGKVFFPGELIGAPVEKRGDQQVFLPKGLSGRVVYLPQPQPLRSLKAVFPKMCVPGNIPVEFLKALLRIWPKMEILMEGYIIPQVFL